MSRDVYKSQSAPCAALQCGAQSALHRDSRATLVEGRTFEASGMSQRVHDAVARGYNSSEGIIAAKNKIVGEALRERWAERSAELRVADLGVGDGALLEQMQTMEVPLCMTGLDVSPAMLRLAASRVRMTPVQGYAEHALKYLAAGHFDLVLAHFILAYVPRPALLEQARGLLAPGGVLSIVTSTKECGTPFFELLERRFRGRANPLRRFIGWAADRALARSTVPEDFAEMAADIQAAGLVVLSRRTLRSNKVFNAPEEAYRFGVEEGWGAGFFAEAGLPMGIVRSIARWGVNQCDYPFNFTHVTEIVEVGRAGEHRGALAANEEVSESWPAELLRQA